MDSKFHRTGLLLGVEGLEKLSQSLVAVFGLGGVGSYAAEAMVRSGLGKIVLIDYDSIDITNINRQVHANVKTVGKSKVEVMKDRLLDINPQLEIEIFIEEYNEDSKQRLLRKDYDYVVDAIDMVSSKINLISSCKIMGIPIISSMGAGNKLSPNMIRIGDIYKTKTCPLAKVIRRELRKREIRDLKVVWSEETPMKVNLETKELRKATPGSVAFVPPVVGLTIASEVIKDLVNKEV